MLSNQERELISKWHSERKLSIRCIARRLDVSRNTVRRWLHGVEKKNNPRSDCGQFLKRQSGEIEKLYAECEFRCPPLRRRIKEQTVKRFRFACYNASVRQGGKKKSLA